MKNLLFLLLEALGHEALPVDHGLLSYVIVGYESEIGLGYFDEVAERVVELDLEILDARPFAFGSLQIGEPQFVVRGQGEHFVERSVVALGDIAAVIQVVGQFVFEGSIEQFGKSGKRVQALGNGVEGGSGERVERL